MPSLFRGDCLPPALLMQQQPLIGTGTLHTAGATGASTDAIDRHLAVDAAEASKTVESSPHFGFLFGFIDSLFIALGGWPRLALRGGAQNDHVMTGQNDLRDEYYVRHIIRRPAQPASSFSNASKRPKQALLCSLLDH